ncbi:hypothetical protein Wenmar_00319 [Wenxinia marina DSM 24838]|uniref:Uncharacterized protein n=2 Tax=Wenxinia TaxID=653686 RepID=A0A0D0Q938_9RHOB|nr:hypothetical protein [Wenxinia marina]KIQ70944.1 hypothetical protein Wenmar_00319 [Wenxinia marina DSM 24838]
MFVYEASIRLHTFYNYFPEDVPTAKEAFERLNGAFTKGDLLPVKQGLSELRIAEFEIVNSYAKILFHLSNPLIPDADLRNGRTNKIRTARRGKDETPVVSAHFIVNFAATGDGKRIYPAVLEETERLSRSAVVSLLNLYLDSQYREQRKNKKGQKKNYSVRLAFIAPVDQTIGHLLEHGGKLKEVKIVRESMAKVTHGDKSYPIIKAQDVRLKTKDEPTGNKAKNILQRIWDDEDRAVKSFKVLVGDPENESTKTVDVDLQSNSILENAFIKKTLLSGFKTPLRQCEDAFRADVFVKIRDLV